MIIKRKVYFFKTVRYIFDQCEDIDRLKKNFDMINILSYQPLSLAGFSCRKKKTPFIDLSKSLDDIFFAFNHTTRNEIRRIEHIDDLVLKSDDSNFEDAYLVYCSHEIMQDRVPEKKEEFYGCKFFSAYYKEELISTVICFSGPKYLRAKAISSKRLDYPSKEILKIISFASRGLMWEACKWGKNNGYIGFDLGSINLTDKKKENIAKFKKSFGGDIIDEYLYTYKNFYYKRFEKVAKFRNRIIKKINRLRK